ncbi:MAG: SEL1-like repeat protein [Desulfovibrionaceae bacterium]|nr:SEL1-like repeat protein [Desulfovibrionaceae bacterium]
MLVPLLIFLVLSYLCISGMGWFAIIPILFMWLILAFISDHYNASTPFADGENDGSQEGKSSLAEETGEMPGQATESWLARLLRPRTATEWLQSLEEDHAFDGMYRMGRPLPKSLKKAVKLWSKAAGEGVTEAQFNLGWMYDMGLGLPKDPQKALEWYQKAAEKGDAKALYNLGIMHHTGKCVPENIAKAMELYEKAAIRGNVGAMLDLATLYLDGGEIPQDIKASKAWYARAALQDDQDAKNGLSRLCGYEEDCISPALQDALEWYEKAAAGGNAEAQYISGNVYEEGMGYNYPLSFTPNKERSLFIKIGRCLRAIVPEDKAKALELYSQAAAQGHADAMWSLGRMYNGTEGIPRDRAKAIECFEKAAEKGHSQAMFELYEIYDRDWGDVPQDRKKARAWLKKAAAFGHFHARVTLGCL